MYPVKPQMNYIVIFFIISEHIIVVVPPYQRVGTYFHVLYRFFCRAVVGKAAADIIKFYFFP